MKLGAFEIEGRIARGSSADVFVASSKATGRVALKVLLPYLCDDPEMVRQFLSEGRLLERLRHPNVTRVFAVEKDRGRAFIALEYVEGCTLADLTLDEGAAMATMVSVLEALHYVHGFAVVHRDLSPHNVLISKSGIVKLADFGVAKSPVSQVRTRTGAIKGQFAYMSPEHARGLPVDRRSDVFACGLLAYELVSGARVYAAQAELEVLSLAQKAEIAPLGHGALGDVIMHALRREPDARYATCEDLASALRPFARADKTTLPQREILAVFADDLQLDEALTRKPPSPAWAALLLLLPAAFLASKLLAPPPPASAVAPIAVLAQPTSEPTPAPPDGFLTVNSRPWSRVTLDGQSLGSTPLRSVKLSAGQHVVEFTTTGGKKKRFDIDISPGKASTLVADWGD